MPELRKDLITDRWVIISTERAKRPQDFRSPPIEPDSNNCPFCPGNEGQTPPELWAARERGHANGPGWKVRIVPNKFPALRVEGGMNREAEGIYDRMNGIGAHEVIIDTPDHKSALEEQSVEHIALALTGCKERLLDLRHDNRFRYLLIFKNVDRTTGASLSHSHYQLIATPMTPLSLKAKLAGAREYFERKDRSVFHDILRQEQRDGTRIVFESDGFLVFCPYASRFLFELCVFPKRQSPDFHSMDQAEILQLADALKVTLIRLGRALERPQYNLIVHTAPTRFAHRRSGLWDTLDHDFRWHIEILPRVTEVAGFEWGTGFFINPVVPEQAAAHLREA